MRRKTRECSARVVLRMMMVVLVQALALALVATATPPGDQGEPQFEAAFQGRCGRASPCEQLCRELHDGTYECGCKEGFVLHLNGYSCHEMNETKSLDNYLENNEDVLYQKDASFSAELDINLLPRDNVTSESIKNDVYNTAKSERSDPSARKESVEDSKIAWTDVTKFNAAATRAKAKAKAKQMKNDKKYTIDDEEYSYNGRMYKELKGLNSLISEGLSNIDINLIKDTDRMIQESVTTLGPSLEQKVPSTSTTGPRTTEISPPCALDCLHGGICYREPRETIPARCLCPLGKGSKFCTEDVLPPSVPSFSGSRSWLALPALRAAYKRVRIRLRFLPTDREDSILLLTGEREDMSGDYLAVVVKGRHVEFRFDCGSGAGVLRTSEPILVNRWNTIYIYRHRWDAWMRLNSGKRVRGRSKGLFSRMTFREPVWLGGAGNTTGLYQKLSVSRGFKGCLHQLKVNGHLYSMRDDAVAGFDVGQCSSLGHPESIQSDAPYNNIDIPPSSKTSSCLCRHGGSCVATGCLCPLGYKGTYCEVVLDMQVPRFNGSSYLRYPGLGNSALSWLEIQITVKPSHGDGLLMYNSHRADCMGDFFALYLRDNFVEFAFDLGTGIAVVRSGYQLKLETWHQINLSRTGRMAMITVDDSMTTDALTPGSFTQLSLSQNLYLGGIPDYDVLDALIAINSSFSGCIKKVVINDLVQQIVSSALGGVNVDDCPHSSNCIDDVCHGGFKEEDSHKNISRRHGMPSQSILTNSSSKELPITLKMNENEKSNSIHSAVVPKKGHTKKPSHTHYYQRWKNLLAMRLNKTNAMHYTVQEAQSRKKIIRPSEQLMDNSDFDSLDTTEFPHFYGSDSYIHIKDTTAIKQLTSYSLDINIRFLVRNSAGLLVWSGRNDLAISEDYFSLGVENGYLTFRYNLGAGDAVIVANQTKVDDGLWHRAKATRSKQRGVLEVDGMGSVIGTAPGNFKELNINTGLYIGGIPSTWRDSNGIYFNGIHGCISKLTLSSNSNNPISLENLGDAQAHNVGKCSASK